MANQKTIADLRDHLFATLEALRDKDRPMEVERARAISDVAQTLINTAKVEIEYARLAGAEALGSEFLTLDPPDDDAEEPEASRALRLLGREPPEKKADHPWRKELNRKGSA